MGRVEDLVNSFEIRRRMYITHKEAMSCEDMGTKDNCQYLDYPESIR